MDCYNKHIKGFKIRDKIQNTCTLKGAHSHRDLEMSDPDPVSPPLFEKLPLSGLKLDHDLILRGNYHDIRFPIQEEFIYTTASCSTSLFSFLVAWCEIYSNTDQHVASSHYIDSNRQL